MATWQGDPDKPVVSICCITYNHEPYIEDALEGFLIQETDFPFEILIHDDASTDRTADIIREYEAKYPKLIKPIYQSENKYSKGIKPNPTFNFPRVQGDFIAFCEGDDFWLTVNKLQRQCEISKQSDVSVVFHSAIELDMSSQEKKIIARQRNSDGVIPLEKSIKGRGGFMPTASLFCSAMIIKEKLHWFQNEWPIGDFFLQMILSYEGRIYYIDEPMCLYRRNVPSSWTDKQKLESESLKYKKAMLAGIIDLYSLLGERDKKYLLAHPTFFYEKGILFNKEKPLSSLWKMLSEVFFWDVSLSFKYIYMITLVSFSFSSGCRQLKKIMAKFS